ncbi:hypothetical protein ACR31U_13075 [Streptomyces rochei]|uniref:hypothetical protein n=1 Tax=Streptomyces rochei TaxID=1928 RepID=UPI00402ADBB4
MLNRIRHAVSLTRARYFPEGRHRRPLTPHRPQTVLASPTSTDEPTATPSRALSDVNRWHSLPGEDVALVRPYVLACERRVWTRSVVVAPRLPAEAWSALVGAC